MGPEEAYLIGLICARGHLYTDTNKIVKHTGRPKVIAFENAFHGRTRAALGLTGNVNPYKHGFFPLETGVHRVPYAYCYRCAFGQSYPDCGMRCLQYLRERLEVSIAPDSVAAIM